MKKLNKSSKPPLDYLSKPPLDYPEFRAAIDDNDPESCYYGPHSCIGCGYPSIIKRALNQGAESWETPCTRTDYRYEPHHCTHVLLFKRLAGKVLTVLDASFPPDSKQLQAIKDLMKRNFAETIANARELEGDSSAESSCNLEQIAEL